MRLSFALRVPGPPNYLVMHSPGTSFRQISDECIETRHALPDHIKMPHLLTKLIREINIKLITPNIWPGVLMKSLLTFLVYHFRYSFIY